MRAVFSFLMLLGISSLAWADAPGIINYQGKLTDQNGNPITDNAGITIVFSLYNVPTGGSYLFQETRTVPIDNGVFVVQIGSETVPGGIPRTVFQNNAEVYLGVKVGADLEMTPRERLVSSPYALAVASGSVGQREIIASTITLSQIDTSSFDTRYSTVGHTHSGIDPGAHQSTHVDGGSDRLTGSLTLTTATLTGSSFSVGGSTLVVTGGNVGIGVTNPSAAFHAVGSATQAPLSVSTGTTAISLYVSTNGNVGIGTTNPTARLAVRGASGGTVASWATASGTTVQYIGQYGGLYITPGILATSGLNLTGSADIVQMIVTGNSAQTSDIFQLRSSGASSGDLLAVQGGGNVGIGTTTPSYRLHISSAAGTTGTIFSVSTGPVDLFRVSGTSAALKVPLYFPDGTMIASTSTLGGSSQWATSGSSISYMGGNVGIGTSNPGDKLVVHGNIYISSGNIRTDPWLQSETNTFLGIGAAGLGSLSNTIGDQGYYNTLVGSMAGNSISTGYSNVFIGANAGNDSGAGSENIFIGRDAGRINSQHKNVFVGYHAGINNEFGTENVFLGNEAGANESGSYKLYIANSGADANNALVYGEFDNKRLTVNGRLGIATTTPSYRLHVSSGAGTMGGVFAVSTGPVDLFRVSGTSAALKVPLYFPDGTVQTTAGGAASQWTTNGSSIGYTGGRVGVGTTNPQAALDISTASSNIGLNLIQNTYAASGVTHGLKLSATQTNEGDYSADAYGGLFNLNANGANWSYALAGINTTNDYNEDSIGVFGSGIGTGLFGEGGVYGLYAYATNASNFAVYAPTGKNYFGGNVGIGDESPNAKLKVIASAGSAALIVSSGTAATQELMRVSSQGYVGVGVSTPSAPLEVNNAALFTSEYDNGNSGAGLTVNWLRGNKQKVTLNNTTTLTLSAPAGRVGNFVLKLVQDGPGNRTVTWAAASGSVKWPSGSAPTLTTAGSAVDIVTFYWDGTNFYGVASLNFQ